MKIKAADMKSHHRMVDTCIHSKYNIIRPSYGNILPHATSSNNTSARLGLNSSSSSSSRGRGNDKTTPRSLYITRTCSLFLTSSTRLQNRANIAKYQSQRVCSVQQPSHQGKEEEEEGGEGEGKREAEGKREEEMVDNTDAIQSSMESKDSTVDTNTSNAGGRVETGGAVKDSGQQPKIASGGVEEESFVQGVLEEVGLIQWPTIAGALLNTVLVIGIVLGTSLVLLAVNTGLAELSRDIYSKL
eukprot:jgi/Picsp_1/5361/NSC_02722-R1_protein